MAEVAGEAFYKVFSQELFPTLLRSTAQGLSFGAARIAVGTVASEIANAPQTITRVAFCCFSPDAAEHHKTAFAELGLA